MKGFSHVEILIVLVVIGVVALAGFTVLNNSSEENSTTNTAEESQNEERATSIQTSNDLNDSVGQLREIDLDTRDEEEQLRNLAN